MSCEKRFTRQLPKKRCKDKAIRPKIDTIAKADAIAKTNTIIEIDTVAVTIVLTWRHIPESLCHCLMTGQ